MLEAKPYRYTLEEVIKVAKLINPKHPYLPQGTANFVLASLVQIYK